jgi:outer membrane lipoprotein-sorting protein
MAGVNVLYDDGKFTWAYTAGTTPATELRLKWGTGSGMYPNQKIFAPSTTGANVRDVLPAGTKGQLYAKLVSANAKGEGVASAELPFVVGDGLPDGSLTFSIA